MSKIKMIMLLCIVSLGVNGVQLFKGREADTRYARRQIMFEDIYGLGCKACAKFEREGGFDIPIDGTLRNLRVGTATLVIDEAEPDNKCPHGYQQLTVTTPDGSLDEFECAQFSVTIRAGDTISVNTFLEYGSNPDSSGPAGNPRPK